MTQLLPNGKQQFININGKPLVGGKVFTYEVGTNTPKATYQDFGETILNTNPIILDARGQAGIYGTGNYRQVLRDSLDNLIWDQVVPDIQTVIDQLKADLANASDPAKGGAMIGFRGITVSRALDSFISVDWYDSVSDGVADDTAAIRAAIAAAVSRGIQDVYLGKSHMISESITIPAGIVLRGQGRNCRIIPSPTGTFIGGWMFFINSTDGSTPTINFPNLLSGGIRDMVFYNATATANRRGVKGFGSSEIDDLKGFNMSQMVGRPTGFYSDNFRVRAIYCEPVIGTDYQVDIRGLGDGLSVRDLHFPYNPANPGGGTPKALYITGALGGEVANCVGGDVKIENAVVTIKDGHFERAQLLVDSADVDVIDTVFGATTRVPIALAQTSLQNYVFRMKNVQFLYTEGLLEWQGSDLQVAGRYTTEVDGCYRRHSSNTDLTKSQITGILVENSSAVPLSDWNDFSYQLSKKGRILPQFFVERNFQTYFTSLSFPGAATVSTDSTTTFTAATNTYFYAVQIILDRNRLVGRNGTAGEKTIVLTNGGPGSRLDIDYGGRAPTGIIRVYRGTTTGSYDKIIDIPAYNVGRLYDNGLTLNGYPWDTRVAGAAGPVNSIGEESILIDGDRAMFVAATVPTVGTWRINDEIQHSSPAPSGKRGRLCTTSGATGVFVFKAWGAIDA